MRNVLLSTRFVTLAQASQITQLSTRTLRRAIADGHLGAHRVRRLIRIDAAELQRWVESGGAAPAVAPRHHDGPQ